MDQNSFMRLNDYVKMIRILDWYKVLLCIIIGMSFIIPIITFYYALWTQLIRNRIVNNDCYGRECFVALCPCGKFLSIPILLVLLAFVIKTLLLIMLWMVYISFSVLIHIREDSFDIFTSRSVNTNYYKLSDLTIETKIIEKFFFIVFL